MNKKEEGSDKKQVDEEDITIRTSCIIIEGVMYEQVYDEQANISYFVKQDCTEKFNTDGTTTYFKYQKIEHDGLIYKPLIGEELRKKVVLLPTHAHMYVDIEELIDKIRNHIHKYCDVSEEFEQLATYYVLITYVYDQFTEIPYLSLMGDTGTGKTRARDVIGMICYKPIITNGGASSAALYRITEKWGGSVLVDEADIKDSDEQNDMIKYYNCGYQKNSPIMKCDKNDPNIINFFNPYCPKIITRRQPFEDKATESRCITEIMMTTGRKDIPFNLPNSFFEECLFLRNKLTMFRLCCWKNYKNISIDDINSVFCDFDIEPRLKQASNCVVYLLKPFPGLLLCFKQYLVKKQYDLINERSESFDGEIINAVFDLVVVGKRDVITSNDIAEIVNGGVFDVKQKVDVRKIGRRLKSLGVKVDKPRWVGSSKLRVINVDSGKMADLYKKYVVDVWNVGTFGALMNNKCDIADKWNVIPFGTLNSNTIKKIDNLGLEQAQGVPYYNVPNGSLVPKPFNPDLTEIKQILEKPPTNEKMAFTIITKYPKDNAEIFETCFSKEEIELLLKQGIIYENPPGTYRLT